MYFENKIPSECLHWHIIDMLYIYLYINLVIPVRIPILFLIIEHFVNQT